MLRWGKGLSWTASVAVLLSLCAASAAGSERQAHRMSRPAGSPAYVWLWYADGTAIPTFSQYCGALPAPPAYQCNFGSGLEDCQRQVQAYLDAWYKDFNLVFTLGPPPSGDYYVIVVASGWPQCATEVADLTGGVAGNEGGIAPWNYCNDNPNQTAIALQCGKNAHDCAAIIAHEHGHLAGLLHTNSTTDVMNLMIQSSAAGFEDLDDAVVLDNPVLADACENTRTQNSYRRMLDVLGPWPGGDKPSLFPDIADAGVDAPPADARHSGGSVGPATGATVDGGAVVVLPGFDALTRPPLPTTDALTTTRDNSHGGCDLAGRPSATTAVAILLYLLVAGFIRKRGRHVQLASERPLCARPARSPSASRSPGC
jgi:hypothetical protein